MPITRKKLIAYIRDLISDSIIGVDCEAIAMEGEHNDVLSEIGVVFRKNKYYNVSARKVKIGEHMIPPLETFVPEKHEEEIFKELFDEMVRRKNKKWSRIS